MKKLLLLGMAVSISLSVNSQSRKVAPGVQVKPVSQAVKPMKAEVPSSAKDMAPINQKPFAGTSSTAMKTSGVVTEAIIGQTTYDLQSNRGTAKRISNNLDGSLSAVWTMVQIGGSNGTDRGTGYNYYDGTSWGAIPTFRIEGVRTGFTNIDWTAQAGEYTCAHSADKLMLTYRTTKGTGPWVYDSVGTHNLFTGQADVWSRFALGGAAGNSVHVIVNSQGTGTTPVIGQSGPMTYSRSLDGGINWDKDHVILPGDSADQYFGTGAEEYHIDAKGDVIAIVKGGFTHDVVLYKSMDNGNTWTKTIVMPFPIPLYDAATMISDADLDGIADTINTNAGDVTVTIDNNGVCHLAWGDMFMLDDDLAAAEGFFPDTDGLLYWKEGMTAPMMIASAIDYNGNGFIDIPENTTSTGSFFSYNIGLTGHPSIGFDAANNIYITYSSIDERADTNSFQQALRHVFAKNSTDGGLTWSAALDVVIDPAGSGAFSECVYPSTATVVDANMHIVYQRDPAPGHTLSTDPIVIANNANPSEIVYASVPVGDFVMGVAEHNNVNSDWVSANYPNPVKDFTSITVKLTKTSDVTLEITNMVGQVMYSEKQNALSAGNHIISIDASHLDAGVYFYNVTAGDQKVSRKMIVE